MYLGSEIFDQYQWSMWTTVSYVSWWIAKEQRASMTMFMQARHPALGFEPAVIPVTD
jgi:hypothetical protein